MYLTRVFALACGLAAVLPLQRAVAAANTPINIPVSGGIFDMVYDTQRGILYMTTGQSDVLRFQMSTQTFLSPLKVLGNLRGLDISADANSLAIADNNSSNNMVWVDEYSLASGKFTRITGASGESGLSGTLDAAFDGKGRIAVTATFNGSGAGVPMYVADPAHGTWRRVTGNNTAFLTQETAVQSSPDHTTVAFTAGDISNGFWGTVNTAAAKLSVEEYANAFTYAIAVSAKGKFFAIPTYVGTIVADHQGMDLETIGQEDRVYFDGVAFDPINPLILYQSLANSTVVQSYDISNSKLLHTYQTGVSFPQGENGPFGTGYLRIAADGSYLFANSGTGVVAIPLR